MARKIEGFAHEGAVRDYQDDDVPRECLSPAGYAIERHPAAMLQSTDGSSMSATFTIVTRDKRPNRWGNMVQIAPGKLGLGLQVEYWNENPVVLYDHGYGSIPFPIGMAQPPGGGKVDYKRTSSKATSTCFFSQTLPDAAIIFGLVDEKILRMSSIGFYPELVIALKERAKAALPEGVEDVSTERWRGVDIVQSELVEWSITPIGADRGALRQSLERGSVNGHKFTEAVKQSLATYAERPKVWSPGFTAPAEATGEIKIGRNKLTFSGPVAAVQEWLAGNAVDTKTPTGTTSAKETPATVETPVPAAPTPVEQSSPSITGDQLAEAFATQQHADAMTTLSDELATRFGKLVDAAVKPITDKQAALEKRLNQMTGKLD